MGLPDDAVYAGVEIDRALVEFLRAALDRLGVTHDLRVGDLLGERDLPEADVALALKLLPTLEQQRAGAGAEVLFALPAPVLVASFPRRSLGGRPKGMDESYTRGFEQVLAREGARAERIELPGELVYVVRR
jgi:16S rRNA (guanine(1405)-N(7))-methyltransferase